MLGQRQGARKISLKNLAAFSNAPAAAPQRPRGRPPSPARPKNGVVLFIGTQFSILYSVLFIGTQFRILYTSM